MSWWEDDPRYGKAGWTVVHPSDGGQPYFVQDRRKRRAPPRALRFADLEPGAVLIGCVVWHEIVKHPIAVANEDLKRIESNQIAVVTDRWFDPVAGEDDPLRGQMAAIRLVNQYGLTGSKRGHTLRGLASQRWHYATPEQARLVSDFVAGMTVLLGEWKAGRLTDEEARLRAPKWRTLLQNMGLAQRAAAA